MNETFKSERAPEPVGAFPHAKRVGELLFLSGIGPRVRGSKEIPGVTLDSAGNVASYDIETQCRAVFENVRLVFEDSDAPGRGREGALRSPRRPHGSVMSLPSEIRCWALSIFFDYDHEHEHERIPH